MVNKIKWLTESVARVRKALTAFVASGLAVAVVVEQLGEGQGWETTGLTSALTALAVALGVYVVPNSPNADKLDAG